MPFVGEALAALTEMLLYISSLVRPPGAIPKESYRRIPPWVSSSIVDGQQNSVAESGWNERTQHPLPSWV